MGYWDSWYDKAMPLIPLNHYLYDQGKSLAQGHGVSTPDLSGAKNAIEGDPAAATSALNGLMTQAFSQGKQINSMLQGEKGGSLAYFKPMQQMFGSMYGSKGLMPAKAPGAPGGGTP